MNKLLLYFSWLMCQNGRKETTKVMFVWSLTNIGVQESLSVRWSFKKLINLTTAYSNAVLQIRNPKRSKYTFLKVIFDDWQRKCFLSRSFLRQHLMIANYRVKKFVRKSQYVIIINTNPPLQTLLFSRQNVN